MHFLSDCALLRFGRRLLPPHALVKEVRFSQPKASFIDRSGTTFFRLFETDSLFCRGTHHRNSETLSSVRGFDQRRSRDFATAIRRSMTFHSARSPASSSCGRFRSKPEKLRTRHRRSTSATTTRYVGTPYECDSTSRVCSGFPGHACLEPFDNEWCPFYF